jgi:two-component system response regulator RegA
MKKTILLVDDDIGFRTTLALDFSERNYIVAEAGCLAEIKSLLVSRPDFAVVDLRLEQESGLDAVRQIYEACPHCKIIVLTGYGSIPTAVHAMRLGAANYVTKPFGIEAIEALLSSDTAETELPLKAINKPESLAAHERNFIDFILTECGGNISHAAMRLGLHRQSLQRKLRKFSSF